MSDTDGKHNKTVTSLGKTGEGFIKGSKAYHALQGKHIKLKFQNSGKLTVFKDLGNGKKWTSIFRIDKPHGKVNYNHLNLNKKISGFTKQVTTAKGKVKTIKYDPHPKLPPGAMTVGNGTAKLCQVMNNANKVLVPIAIAVDTCRVGYAGYQDFQNKTSRNVVETTTSVAGGWTGGYGGAWGGAAIGTIICPGIGTIIGGLCGGLTGGITGAVVSGILVDKIGDAVDYDIVEIECENCKIKFKARKYKGETICNHCLEKLNEIQNLDDGK